jgi:hypothetical protein
VGTGSSRTSAPPRRQEADFPLGDMPSKVTSHPASAAERAVFCTRESATTPLHTSITMRPRFPPDGESGGSASKTSGSVSNSTGHPFL